MKQTICFQCSEKINTKKEKYVVLATMNMLHGGDDIKNYHFDCWVDYIKRTIGNQEKNQKFAEAQNFMMNNPQMMQMAQEMVKSLMTKNDDRRKKKPKGKKS